MKAEWQYKIKEETDEKIEYDLFSQFDKVSCVSFENIEKTMKKINAQIEAMNRRSNMRFRL